jgi:LysM repeat protein
LYDKASRETHEFTYTIDTRNAIELTPRDHFSVYDHAGQLSHQTTRRNTVNGWQTESDVSYYFDAAGRLQSYVVNANRPDGTYSYTSYFVNSYTARETYLDAGQSVSSSGPDARQAGTTTRSYNAHDELTSFVDSGDPTHGRDRYFANDVSGQALTVVQGSITDVDGAFNNAVMRRDNLVKAQHFFFANGQQIGSFGQLQDASGKFAANFDVNYTPVSTTYASGNAPATVVAQTNDTLRSIAARVYGDASLWYVIAEENGLTDPAAIIQEGTIIRIPNEVVSLSDSSNSFKPFQLRDALGDTTPTQQPIPQTSSLQCQTVAKVIGIVVGAIVGYYTAGIGAGPARSTTEQVALAMFNGYYDYGAYYQGVLRTVNPANIGTTVGEILRGGWDYWTKGTGEATEIETGVWNPPALGIRDSFDQQSGAISAVEGVGSYFGSDYGGAVGGALGGYAARYLASNALGRDMHWSWREVAANVAASSITEYLGLGNSDNFLESLAGNFVNSGISYGVNKAYQVPDTHWNWSDVAWDSFGHTLGNGFVRAIAQRPPTYTGLGAKEYAEINNIAEAGAQASREEFYRQIGVDYQKQVDQDQSESDAYWSARTSEREASERAGSESLAAAESVVGEVKASGVVINEGDSVTSAITTRRFDLQAYKQTHQATDLEKWFYHAEGLNVTSEELRGNTYNDDNGCYVVDWSRSSTVSKNLSPGGTMMSARDLAAEAEYQEGNRKLANALTGGAGYTRNFVEKTTGDKQVADAWGETVGMILIAHGVGGGEPVSRGSVEPATETAQGAPLSARYVPEQINTGLGGVVPRAVTGVTWGRGIQGQGLPWETYVESQNTSTQIQNLNVIKTNFKTFERFDFVTGEAISDKTLNTSDSSYQKYGAITSRLNDYVDQIINFKGDGVEGGFRLEPSMIQARTMQLGIPATANTVQWMEINGVISSAQAKGVKVVVTQTRE